MENKYDRPAYDAVWKSLDLPIRDYIDRRAAATHEDRRQLTADAGRAMIISGACFLGAACDLPADEAIAIADDALAAIRAAASRRKENNEL